jgi:hypothetical protein
MATINVTLADELKTRAESEAMEAGFPSVDAYLASLIEWDVSVPVDAELEADLLAGAQSPAREISNSDWALKQQTLIEKFAPSKR